MLRRAGSRACGSLLVSLQNKGLLHVPKHNRPLCAARDAAFRFSSAAFSSCNGLRHNPPPRSIVQLYLHMLAKRPVLTKSVTAATIYFFADTTSQGISKYRSDNPEKVEWDVKRTLRMVAAGFCLSGPTLHVWFSFVSKVVPGRDLISTLKKMAMGQLIYGPIFTVAFFSLNAFVQGESFDEIVSRIKRDFIPTIRSGLMYWPVCDFITYRYVPVHLQPLVSNSFSFLWTIYFTYMACSRKVEVKVELAC
eukprot:c13680_g1_i1 orf=140-889(+)